MRGISLPVNTIIIIALGVLVLLALASWFATHSKTKITDAVEGWEKACTIWKYYKCDITKMSDLKVAMVDIDEDGQDDTIYEICMARYGNTQTCKESCCPSMNITPPKTCEQACIEEGFETGSCKQTCSDEEESIEGTICEEAGMICCCSGGGEVLPACDVNDACAGYEYAECVSDETACESIENIGPHTYLLEGETSCPSGGCCCYNLSTSE